MARYVDADELELEYYDLSIHGTMAVKSVLPVFAELLKKQPTADVAEVKHGYWYEVDSDVGWELVRCSICGKEPSLCDGEEKTDYCPYCGAKMDGKDGERG